MGPAFTDPPPISAPPTSTKSSELMVISGTTTNMYVRKEGIIDPLTLFVMQIKRQRKRKRWFLDNFAL
jgi:hypothetical protein